MGGVHRGRGAAIIAGALFAGALGFATAPGAGAGEDDSPRERPREWDEELLPLVDAVESLRGLHFEHPVPVQFLSDRKFEREFESDSGELTKRERRDLEEATGALRALGLFEGDADELFESAAEVDAEGTLAFYDSEEERIVIRGRDLDLETEVTVVHELVHALQDQHFDLDKLVEKTKNTTEETALTGLVEGDAVRIEEDHVATLSLAQQDEYYAASANTATEVEAGLSDVPEIIPVLLALPYDFGPFFVYEVVAAGGNDDVDAAFRDPPVTDEHIFDPATFLDGDDPDEVAKVDLDEGEKKVGDREPLGALGWFYMLASRIDIATAIGAVEGWGGDEFVQFDRDGTNCVRAAFKGETPADTEQMAAGLEQWAAAIPTGAAQVERGDQVTVTSCDPGEGAVEAPNSLLDAETVLFDRALIAFILEQPPQPADPAAARCAATILVFDPANAEWIASPEPTEEQSVAFFERADAALAECT